jgi:hypothetical protein
LRLVYIRFQMTVNFITVISTLLFSCLHFGIFYGFNVRETILALFCIYISDSDTLIIIKSLLTRFVLERFVIFISKMRIRKSLGCALQVLKQATSVLQIFRFSFNASLY